MEKYEQLVKQFNELIDRINAYEILIEKQQSYSMEKLNLMKDLFKEQQKGFEELKNATSFYESIFRENYENIVDVLSNKLINTIMQMTDKKLLEVQNAVTPVKEEFIKTNITLESIRDESILLEKKFEKINIIEDKLSIILDSFSKNTQSSKNDLDNIEDNLSIDMGVFIENCRIKLFQYVLYSGKKFDIKKIDSILNTFLSSCIQAESVMEINDYYLQAKLKIDYLFEG